MPWQLLLALSYDFYALLLYIIPLICIICFHLSSSRRTGSDLAWGLLQFHYFVFPDDVLPGFIIIAPATEYKQPFQFLSKSCTSRILGDNLS